MSPRPPQNQALSALLFLYQQVLDRKLDYMDKIERVKRPAKIRSRSRQLILFSLDLNCA